jgi:hypothetical protein
MHYLAVSHLNEQIEFSGSLSPRKYLMEHYGRKSARKMYRDTPDGKGRHAGWIVAGRWFDVFRVYALGEKSC